MNRFNAKEFDAETGNYYYGARYYDPKWSLWISVDAEFARFPAYSPYNYTLQNPINLIEPDGNAPDTCPTCPKGWGNEIGIWIFNKARQAESYIKNEGRGLRIWGNGPGRGSTRTEGRSEGPDIDLNDLPTVFGPRKLKIKGDGKTNAGKVFKSFANNFGQGAEAGGKVDDAVESVNKLMEGASALSKKGGNVNEDMVAYEFDFWKNGEPHGGGDGAIGEAAAAQRKNELQNQFPDLDITIRPVDQPHPHHQKNEKE